MSALKSVVLAIDVATRKRDQAGKLMVQADRACHFARSQLEQLESYAADTESRWTAVAQVSISPTLLFHHYQFMERLRYAIGLQNGVLEDLNRQLEGAKKRTLEAEFRLAGLEKVMHRKKTDLAKALSRREQKQMDEFASMQYSRAVLRLGRGEIS
jgi:flagellar FliJ protein